MKIVRLMACLGIAAGLAACDQPSETRAYWEHPEDAQVKKDAMYRCLAEAKGPATTHYNDLNEAIEGCERFASDVARYCPPNPVPPCLPQYQRSQAEVRRGIENTESRGGGK